MLVRSHLESREYASVECKRDLANKVPPLHRFRRVSYARERRFDEEYCGDTRHHDLCLWLVCTRALRRGIRQRLLTMRKVGFGCFGIAMLIMFRAIFFQLFGFCSPIGALVCDKAGAATTSGNTTSRITLWPRSLHRHPLRILLIPERTLLAAVLCVASCWW